MTDYIEDYNSDELEPSAEREDAKKSKEADLTQEEAIAQEEQIAIDEATSEAELQNKELSSEEIRNIIGVI